MSKKLFFLLLAACLTLNVNAQKASTQFESTYKAAKHLLDEGKYGLAMQSFKKLLAKGETNKLVPFAQFYLGNAAYQNGDTEYAKNVFLELTVKYPDWNKIEAAYLWLSRLGFEQSGSFKGMLYATKITSEPYLSKSNNYLKQQLSKEPFEVLQELYFEYNDNKEVATAFAYVLNLQQQTPENKQLLDSLINKFELDRDQFNSIPPSVHKNHYEIGIMLPFYIDRVEATGKYLKKSLAVDIYEGAKMAAYDTDSSLFTLKVFDTKKDSSQVRICMENGGGKELDAVLGPIYPKPVQKMKEISRKNKINFLNPTSSNSAICKDNPYAFLSRSTATQLAKASASFIKSQEGLKNVYIYYGTSEVDSISAYVYKTELEADSFQIKSIIKIGPDNRRDVYDGLTDAKQIVDRRKVGRMTKEQIKNAFRLPRIDSLLIPLDSIGHIFIASSDPTISTEAMSAIISRGDSVKIMGVGNWFESNDAGLGIMEGLGVTLAISAVDDVSTLEYKELTRRYIEKHKTQPSKYFFRGYFGMKMITESLKEYGTYFQNGYHNKGNFNPMFNFESTNSNASIKIIRLVNNNIEKLVYTEGSN